jgi:AraC family transcriptional regulator, exoenzyme S synthesis regulatory protein ExsA
MVLSHQKFDLEGKCLIEKVVVQPPFRYAANFPNEACFIHFSEGAAKINSPSEQVEVEKGESVLLKCGNYFADLMKYGKAGQYEILVVHLYPDVIRKIYRYELPSFIKDPETRSFIHKVVPHDTLEKFIEGLYFYFDNPSLVSDELLELKLKELVLLLVQTKNAGSIISLFTDLFTPRDQSVKEIVNNHLFSDLSIEDLASLANLSASTFNRTFQSLFNDTPASYIKRKRLERARDLLAMSTLTISEIAFQTCFDDVAHFSRSFKALYNCSPSAYRMTRKAQNP